MSLASLQLENDDGEEASIIRMTGVQRAVWLPEEIELLHWQWESALEI